MPEPSLNVLSPESKRSGIRRRFSSEGVLAASDPVRRCSDRLKFQTPFSCHGFGFLREQISKTFVGERVRDHPDDLVDRLIFLYRYLVRNEFLKAPRQERFGFDANSSLEPRAGVGFNPSSALTRLTTALLNSIKGVCLAMILMVAAACSDG